MPSAKQPGAGAKPTARNLSGGKDVALDDAAFGARFNGPLVHEAVRAELAARRQGTASTKAAAKLVGDWGPKGSILVVLHDSEERAALSFRNLDQVRAVLPVSNVGVADVIAAANVLASPEALEALAARGNGIRTEQEEVA